MSERGAPHLPAGQIQRYPTPDESGPGEIERGAFGVHGSGDTSGFGGLVRRPFVAPTAERPYGGWFDDVTDALVEAQFKAVARALREATAYDDRVRGVPSTKGRL